MTPSWKLLFQSVRGTAHVRSGQPCQDACVARLTASGRALVLACADGAGSAAHADVGARTACREAVRLVRSDLAEGLPVEQVDRDTALSWLGRLRKRLEAEAGRLGSGLEGLACTLLLALVGENASAFVQIGDGAIVTPGDGYGTVFWPQSGEYVNSTNFVTDAEYESRLEFAARPGRVDEVALLTDGLQGLALHYASRQAHQPFFRPLFARLRQARAGEGLALALRRFLDAEAVNARTDDDKTLVLATRVSAHAAESAL